VLSEPRNERIIVSRMVGAPSSDNYRTRKVEINVAISLPSILSRVYSWRKLFLRNSQTSGSFICTYCDKQQKRSITQAAMENS
jgi:hypothetical protein